MLKRECCNHIQLLEPIPSRRQSRVAGEEWRLACLANLPIPIDFGERDGGIAVKSKYATSVEARHIVGELRLCEEEI